MATEFTVVPDAKDLAALKRKLGPDLYRAAVADFLTTAALKGEGYVKQGEPSVTGNLRRSTQSDVRSVNDARAPESRVVVGAVYGDWIETGETASGRKMLTRPGGYRMVENADRKIEGETDHLLDVAARKIEERWAE